MYVEERVYTVEARKVRAMPRRQGAKPYEAHSLWRKSVTSARKKEKKAMPPWPNGDSEGATARWWW